MNQRTRRYSKRSGRFANIAYGLRKANEKNVWEHQQQVIEAYCCGKDVFFVFVFVLWQLATTQIVRAKMTWLDAIFCRENISSSSLRGRGSKGKGKGIRVPQKTLKKSTPRTSPSWKNLSSTCRQVQFMRGFLFRSSHITAALNRCTREKTNGNITIFKRRCV